MAAKKLLVLGGGFAGLWSTLAAARQRDLLGLAAEALEITLVNRDRFHAIRVRNYEADLSALRIPLPDLLGPVGIRFVEADVLAVDATARSVAVSTPDGASSLAYDRLVFALGSELRRPAIPGLAEHGFDVDTWNGASRLQQHLQGLAGRPDFPGRSTVVVVGAGLTGIEVASELPSRLESGRVVLVDHSPRVGSAMGESAQPVIEAALAALGIETRLGAGVAAITPAGVTFSSGEAIDAATVVWCAGMQASPLTGQLPLERDRLGRLPVDGCLRVQGVEALFAAGDCASVPIDAGHSSVMSCQHSRPMGRFAGHNAVCDLFGQPLLPLQLADYVTVLDLGAWGALYTEGWERRLVSSGAAAKQTKQLINRQRIVPPLSGDPAALLAAAAPVTQAPPPNLG
ncbi:NAD(P)/FAD-dependent oxidoreductase [Synechococcus sp. CS-1324]|uniref:NAD(P)/FAD-dependent oxidoreductase n=1 Tax=unclassified Synechococcus TaxID=2626047 RepID=UPI000DB644F2|nr:MULTISPECIES: NAD(P)/FAD-dependent oxidoreductase [unclassified Synechococcus]MCT0213989.1 NAD(P)/FAD-dependent oxidoreductase [Synechococcus sp. CS-1326]MCT0230055.1 NAD(P)/FAD-dependent oxidoreductase [Synechococcus sp. CS-1324]MCT0233565.1 NAD(P)/FAD-dependent oxidoreductase [Synechococcus sp. CS-1327]PZV03789.1 MAG: proton-conducting membrane transporter [Cyanobium sp.]